MSKKKDGKIELLRFLGICFIMCDHMHKIGLKDLERPFSHTWIYVEFFLFLSGFMTARHFQKKEVQPTEAGSYVKEGILYTCKKYAQYMPYVVCAVLLQYLLLYHGFLEKKDFLGFFSKVQEMPFEMLLLSAAGMNGTRLFPIWFLSATFLVSPVICIICQIKNVYLKGMLAFYPAVFYYLNIANGVATHDYPNQIVRAFCGMLMGVLLFLLSERIKAKSSDRRSGYVFRSVVLCVAYVVLLFISYKSLKLLSLYLLCFIVIICLTFCEKTFIPSLSNPVFLYLGRLSMPMFIWHWVIARLVVSLFPGSGVTFRIVGYYLGTIAVSVISMEIVEYIKKTRIRRHQKEKEQSMAQTENAV